jgi:hypothetical protein
MALRNAIGDFEVAGDTGTSVQIIQRHYRETGDLSRLYYSIEV